MSDVSQAYIDEKFRGLEGKMDTFIQDQKEANADLREDKRAIFSKLEDHSKAIEKRPTYKEVIAACFAVSGLIIAIVEVFLSIAN